MLFLLSVMTVRWLLRHVLQVTGIRWTMWCVFVRM